MIPYRAPGEQETGLAVLGRKGQVWFPGSDIPDEQIDDAGVAHRPTNKIGYVSNISQFRDELFVCGQQGQFYRRRSNLWYHDDAGLLRADPDFLRKRPVDKGRSAVITRVATPDGGDFYACGTFNTAWPALFWRPEGEQQWRWLGLDTSDDIDFKPLLTIHAESRQDVWIPTKVGVLLRGNGRQGFRIATDVARRPNGDVIPFSSLVRYRGSLYGGGATVCRLTEEGTWEPQSGSPELHVDRSEGGGTLIRGGVRVFDNTLWAVTGGSISRFDGRAWQRLAIPQIYRNR